MECNDMPVDEQLQKEYEAGILSMLISGSKEKQEHILKHLCADMFTGVYNKEIFKAAEKLFKEKQEIINADLIESIKKEHLKKLAADLSRDFITAANCDYYLNKLLNRYLKRLLKQCETFEEYKKAEEIKRKYELKSGLKPISYNTEMLVKNYFDNWENPVKTYFPSVDKRLGSLQGGDIMILAGATGMGKTCMMLNLIMSMAKHKTKILLFSLEMTLAQLQNRIVSAELNIDSDKVRNFKMTDEERNKYIDYVCSNPFENLNIEVCTDYNLNTSKIRDIVLSNEADVIFIDYMGLIKSEIKGNAYERVSEISRDLKLLALEVNKPFIVLHQLNRIPPERKEKRPLLSDLRDSGKIEQDADFICFVFRPAYYEKSSDPKCMEFIISKSRHTAGKTDCWLMYDGAKQKITDPHINDPEDGFDACRHSLGL